MDGDLRIGNLGRYLISVCVGLVFVLSQGCTPTFSDGPAKRIVHNNSKLGAPFKSGELTRTAVEELSAKNVYFKYNAKRHDLFVSLYFYEVAGGRESDFRLAAAAVQAFQRSRVLWSKEVRTPLGESMERGYAAMFHRPGASVHSYLLVTGTTWWHVKVRATYSAPPMSGADEYVLAQIDKLLRSVR